MFSSLILSLSLLSAYSSSALYVSFTFPVSKLADRLSSHTIVANSSKLDRIHQYPKLL